MPFIQLSINREISKKQETALKTGLGTLITEIDGKTEKGLMLDFRGNSNMWFAGGNEDPAVFLHVMLYGNADKDDCKRFSEKSIGLIKDVMDIEDSHIYVKFDETLNFYWG